MNKLFTKLAKLFLGTAMAAGVGVAIESYTTPNSISTDATAATISFNSGSGAANTVTYKSKSYVGAKLGASKSKTGSAQFTVVAGSTTCSFFAAGWSGKSVSLSVSISSGTITPSSVDLKDDSGVSGSSTDFSIAGTTDSDFLHEFTLSGVTSSATVTVQTNKSGNDTRAAIWNANYTAGTTWTVDFNVQGHGTAPSSQEIADNGKVTQPSAPTATGYTFGGWYKESACTNAWNFSADTVTAATTLFAKWTVKTSSLTFNLNGGSGTPASGKTATYGASMPTYDQSAPTKTGHTFGGFYDGSGGTGTQYYTNTLASARNWDKDTTSGTTLYAKWNPIAYTVSFDVQGHGTAPSSQSIDYGSKVPKPSDPTADGYKFKGWFKESDCTNAWDFSNDTITGDTDLYAKWVVTYVVTFNTQGHGTAPSAQIIETGTKVAKPSDLSATGYVFGGWYKEQACTNAWDFSTDTVSTNTILWAKWTVKTSALTFNLNDGEGTTPDNLVAIYGSDMPAYSEEAPTKTGHIFAGFYDGTGGTGTQYYTSTLVSARTWDKNKDSGTELYAKWTPIPYTVSFNVQGHGSAPSNQTINYGSKATQPSNPSATGYTFGGWYKESSCTNTWNFSSDVVLGDTVLYAKWTINSYLVSFDAQGHGSTPDNQNINYGGKVVEPENDPTEAGFSFGGWYKESSCTNAWDFENDTVVGITTLYAKWTDIRTVITLSAEDMTIDVNDSDQAPVVASSPTGHTTGYVLSDCSDTTVVTIQNNKVHPVAKGTATITVSIPDTTEYRYISDTFTVTVIKTMADSGEGTIKFGSAAGSIKINDTSVTGDDSQANTWTVTTAGTTSFTQQASFSQVGSSSKPASTITFTTTLAKEVRITDFYADFGGFSGTAGTITMKVGSTTVGTGSLSGTSDVTVVSDTDDIDGKELTITVTGISKGVKVYGITYEYFRVVDVTSVSLNATELSLTPNATYDLVATISPNNATNKNVTWSVIDADPAGCVTVSDSGTVTAVADGTATVKVTTEDGNKTATCSITVATPEGAYVNISSNSAMGIVDDEAQEISFTYGGSFTGALGVTTSNSGVNVVLTDNEDGTGKISFTFVSAGTTVISFLDGEEPIENDGSTCTVTVVEKLNNIDKYQQYTSTLTYTTTYTGEETSSDGVGWTVDSDASQSTYESRGIHYGTGNTSVSYLTLTSDDSYANVTSITLNAATGSGVTATISVTVGGIQFGGDPKSLTSSSANYTFTGSKTDGEIVITIAKPESATGALFFKSLSITHTGSIPSNLANTNPTVQKEVLGFVQIMNSDLAVCGSEELTSLVWTELAGKFDTAKNAATDKTLFVDMFKYASSTPRDGSGAATSGDSLQNALARYDYILKKYNTKTNEVYSDFLGRVSSGQVEYNSSRISPLAMFGNNSNTITAMVIVSMVSITAIGGYFFLRKRKEQ